MILLPWCSQRQGCKWNARSCLWLHPTTNGRQRLAYHPLLNFKDTTPTSSRLQDGQWLNKQANSNWITARTLEIIQDESCLLSRIKRCANVLPILAFIYPCNDGHCINNICKKNAKR
nr:hypothetical protein [Halomonas bluephagenesis]